MKYNKTTYNRLYAGDLEDWELYTDDNKGGIEELENLDKSTEGWILGI